MASARTIIAALALAAAVLLGAAACASTGDQVATSGSIGSAPSTSASTPGSGLRTTTSAVPGTLAPADAWATCRTRLDLDRVVLDIGAADPAARAAALSLLHAMPVPPGLDDAWSVLVRSAERTDVLARQVKETDQKRFDRALSRMAADDPELESLAGRAAAVDGKRMRDLRVAGPCDATGMPPTWGCAEPTACTQRWIDAQAAQDTAAVDQLGSVRLRLTGAAGTRLQAGTCASSPSYPGGTRCELSDGSHAKATVDWWKTTDGRWYGIDAQMSKFEAVASAIS